jgi:hypothetical protein
MSITRNKKVKIKRDLFAPLVVLIAASGTQGHQPMVDIKM